MSSDQARIMIWSTPRSLSTAFSRSMSARGDTKVFFEPYLGCYNYGPDRKVHWADAKPGLLNEKYTFSYVNCLMEKPYPDSKVIFAKCMVEAIASGDFNVVAPGYKHTFLIRHPLKMFRSYEKLSKGGVIDIDFRTTYKNIYQDLEKFYDHVTNVLGQSAPAIIDADDLVAQPKAVVSKYCQLVGVAYTPNMLKWESVNNPADLKWECIDVGVISQDSYTESLVLLKAFKSTGFGDGSKKREDIVEEELSGDVREIAGHAMPAYERLHKLRIKP